jgi:hypothetical protein
MKHLPIACLFATSLAFVLPECALAQRSSDTYTSRYNVLSERNIFLKDRSQPATRPAPVTQPSPRDPERSVWLTGVVLEGDGYRAYIENQMIGTVMRLAVGDAIARGKITAIEIDAVAYEVNGHVAWIEIGNDFANQPIASAGESISITDAPTTMPAGLEGLYPNDPNLTVEQRLRLRRLQELKGQ